MSKLIVIAIMAISIIGQSQPSQDFFYIIAKIEGQGYHADSLRARKAGYKELLEAKPSVLKGHIFYNINPNLTKIVSLNTLNNYFDQQSLSLFINAKSVWTYFYRSDTKDKNNIIADGIIEQWEFGSNEVTQLVADKLNSIYPIPFFNTQPFYIQSKNKLYIFHCRADMFSYKQKEFFNLFKELLK